MVFIPAFFVEFSSTLVQVCRCQLHSVLTDWTVDGESVDSNSKYRGGLFTHRHLYAGRVVVVVVDVVGGWMSLTDVQLFKVFDIHTAFGSRIPAKYGSPRGCNANVTQRKTPERFGSKDRLRMYHHVTATSNSSFGLPDSVSGNIQVSWEGMLLV